MTSNGVGGPVTREDDGKGKVFLGIPDTYYSMLGAEQDAVCYELAGALHRALDLPVDDDEGEEGHE